MSGVIVILKDWMKFFQSQLVQPQGIGHFSDREAIIEAHVHLVAGGANLHADMPQSIELGTGLADFRRRLAASAVARIGPIGLFSYKFII